MKIAIAADHAGFALKEKLRLKLADEGHEVVDFGTGIDGVLRLSGFRAAGGARGGAGRSRPRHSGVLDGHRDGDRGEQGGGRARRAGAVAKTKCG